MNDAAGAAGQQGTRPERGREREPDGGRGAGRERGRRAVGAWVRRLPRWGVVPLGAAVGLGCGLGYGLTATPQYAATAYVMVVPQHAGGDSASATGFAQAYGRIVTGSAVLAGAQAATGAAAADLRAHVQAATSPDAPMISVTGTADRAGAAAQIADAVAASLARTGYRTAADTGVRLLVFSRATAPDSPASPSVPLSGAVGASTGGLLAALTLLVRRREPGDAYGAYGAYGDTDGGHGGYGDGHGLPGDGHDADASATLPSPAAPAPSRTPA
jgi:capsular polysaccharide biosynthesis protein